MEETMRIAASLISFFLCIAIPMGGFGVEKQVTSEVPVQATTKVKVLSWTPRIFLIENFLTPFECDYMIAKARPELKRSTVVSLATATQGDGDVHEARTSKGMFFQRPSGDLVLKGIERKIAELTMLPEENGEGIQVLSYGHGEEYKPHWDYFDNTTEGGAFCYNRGGQRVATLIMYLANTEEGGETVFPKVNIKVKPVKGNAVLFYNCTPDGVEDPLSLHGGVPVVKGEKWIATKWLRKGEFR
jgi:prolyl 4-hydroxylase